MLRSTPKRSTLKVLKSKSTSKQSISKRSITTKKRSILKKQHQNTISSITSPLSLNTSNIFKLSSTRLFSSIGEGSDAAFQPQTKPKQSPSTPTSTTSSDQTKSQTEQQEDDILQQIDSVVKAYPIVLFMKGSPSQPKCGFSRRVVQILHEFDITYEACDVLESDELREAIKTYSQWPTLPQLFINGEFVGGCDIVTQMYQNGELAEILPKKKAPAEVKQDQNAV